VFLRTRCVTRIASLLLLLLPGRAVAFSQDLTSRLTATVKTLEFELRVPLDLIFERIVSVVSASVNLQLANLLLWSILCYFFTTSIKETVALTKHSETARQTPHTIKMVRKQLFVYDKSELAHLIQGLLCIQNVTWTETRDQNTLTEVFIDILTVLRHFVLLRFSSWLSKVLRHVRLWEIHSFHATFYATKLLLEQCHSSSRFLQLIVSVLLFQMFLSKSFT